MNEYILKIGIDKNGMLVATQQNGAKKDSVVLVKVDPRTHDVLLKSGASIQGAYFLFPMETIRAKNKKEIELMFKNYKFGDGKN